MSSSANPNLRKYYVYEWFIKETGEVFYIGKGCGGRWKTKKRENRFFMNMSETHNCDVRKIKDGLTEDEAFQLEIETIKYYRENTSNRLTNICDGGDNPPILSGEESPTKRLEVRNKISKSNKKVYSDPKVRNEISKRMKEFYSSDTGKEKASIRSKKIMSNKNVVSKISQSNKIHHNTEKFKEKHSLIMKEAYLSEQVRIKVTGSNNGASRRVSQYSLDGKFIKEYNTLKEADEDTGISFKNISKAVRGHRKTAGGFIWKFSDNKNIAYKPKVYLSEPTRECKEIEQYSIDGKLISTYISINEAVRKNGFKNHSNIISNLKEKTKSAYGYIWKYKNNQDNTVPSQAKTS